MICLRLASFRQGALTWLPEDTLAVAARLYPELDDESGPGGTTRGELRDADIKTLGQLVADGERVFYVESDDPSDVLFDDDEQAERESRIWWKVELAEP